MAEEKEGAEEIRSHSLGMTAEEEAMAEEKDVAEEIRSHSPGMTAETAARRAGRV